MSFVYRLSAFATRQLPIKRARVTLDAALASFSFDDFPKSAWTVGGPILTRHGALATYYAVGDFCGRTVDAVEQYDEATLRAVHAAGHEVGCHTFSHQHGSRVASPALAADIARNAEFLAGRLGEKPVSFAYPYGDISPRTKTLLAGLYPSARGITAGLNGPVADLAQLRAYPLEARSSTEAQVEHWVAAAKAANAWLVFFSHDVADAPTPYGCTPRMLEHALETVRAAGIEILPVKDALARALA